MSDNQICHISDCVNTVSLNDLPFCQSHLDALMSGQTDVKIALRHCALEGCHEATRSLFASYCHKHDARVRRRGTTEVKPPRMVLVHSSGYRVLLEPDHPLAKNRRVYEHRKVYFDANPNGPKPCHWCGKRLDWDTTQIDHLNAIRDDNRLDNLVASCGGCNRDRAKPAAVRAHKARAKKFMVNGKWWSIDDAAKHLGVCRSSIMARLVAGWPIERAMTEPRGVTGPKRLAG